jgi:FMN phosphatase YigB (HAD superfamily)
MIGDNYDVDVLIPQELGIRTIWVKNPLTASQYVHLLDKEPKDMINLKEFVELPEIIKRVFN